MSIDDIRAELARIGADHPESGVSVAEHPAGVFLSGPGFRDSIVADMKETLAALRRVPDGAGAEAAWKRLAKLD